MSDSRDFSDWSAIKEQRRQMMQHIVSELSDDERQVFTEVLRLNMLGRHQNSPRVVQPLFDFVSEKIR